MSKTKKSSSAGYAAEKYLDALRILATRSGDLKSRLSLASLPIFMAPLGSLPRELRQEAEWINSALTRKHPSSQVEQALGSVIITLHRMNRKRAIEIAERVFSLYFLMDAHVRREIYSGRNDD